MPKWFEENSLFIGHTPLVRLNRAIDHAPATVLAKIEGGNPAHSVKRRLGAAMIRDAEKKGLLGPGKGFIKPTSGDTGIALAYVAAARGNPLTLTMPEPLSLAAEPESSPILTGKRAGPDIKPGPHKIQGIGAGFIPGVLDLALVDQVAQVSNKEVIFYARRLARKEGIRSGISSGAAVFAAARLAKKSGNAHKTIVVILPDSGERYLSSALFDAKGLAA